MTNAILKDEILKDEQLDNVAGGAGVASWLRAIGGTLLGVSAGVASIFNPALFSVAVVSLAEGARGITEVATDYDELQKKSLRRRSEGFLV